MTRAGGVEDGRRGRGKMARVDDVGEGRRQGWAATAGGAFANCSFLPLQRAARLRVG